MEEMFKSEALPPRSWWVYA